MLKWLLNRFLAMKWMRDLRTKKRQLEENLDQINSLIQRHNYEAFQFKSQISKSLWLINNFILEDYGRLYEGYELDEVKKRNKDDPVLSKVTKDLELLLEENRQLHNELKRRELNNIDEEEKNVTMRQLEHELGPKANELDGMIRGLKDNIKRISNDVKLSKKLPIKIQHPYQYSKWDSINEPYNVVENVLKDDDSIYKALAPDFDFTLNNGKKCFVSEVLIHSGDGGPADVEVYTSDFPENWNFVEAYECSNDDIQRLTLPGEQIGKFIRIRWLNNNQGGNIVKIRYIEIIGLIKS